MYIMQVSQHFWVWPFLPDDLRWSQNTVLWSQNTGNDTNVRDTIHVVSNYWLCLRVTSIFCSSSSSSPYSWTFRLWPDLWRRQWFLGQISHLSESSHIQATGYLIKQRLNFGNQPSIWEIIGKGRYDPRPQQIVTRQTPIGRGLKGLTHLSIRFELR